MEFAKGEGIAVVLVTVIVTLWLSGLIEQRLANARGLDANLRVVLSKAITAASPSGEVNPASFSLGLPDLKAE